MKQKPCFRLLCKNTDERAPVRGIFRRMHLPDPVGKIAVLLGMIRGARPGPVEAAALFGLIPFTRVIGRKNIHAQLVHIQSQGVEIRTELPKTIVGKILRRMLAASTGNLVARSRSGSSWVQFFAWCFRWYGR